MNIKSNIEQLLEPLNIYNLHEQNETSNEILTYSTPLQPNRWVNKWSLYSNC